MHRPQMQNDVITVGILPWRMFVPKVNTVSVWGLHSPKSLLTRSHKEPCRGLKLHQFGAHFHCSFARTRSGRPASRRIFLEALSTRADRHPGSSCPNPAWDTNRASARSSALDLSDSSELKWFDFKHCSSSGLSQHSSLSVVQLLSYSFSTTSRIRSFLALILCLNGTAIMRWIDDYLCTLPVGVMCYRYVD